MSILFCDNYHSHTAFHNLRFQSCCDKTVSGQHYLRKLTNTKLNNVCVAQMKTTF